LLSFVNVRSLVVRVAFMTATPHRPLAWRGYKALFCEERAALANGHDGEAEFGASAEPPTPVGQSAAAKSATRAIIPRREIAKDRRARDD
jgi:hypothetical protein